MMSTSNKNINSNPSFIKGSSAIATKMVWEMNYFSLIRRQARHNCYRTMRDNVLCMKPSNR